MQFSRQFSPYSQSLQTLVLIDVSALLAKFLIGKNAPWLRHLSAIIIGILHQNSAVKLEGSMAFEHIRYKLNCLDRHENSLMLFRLQKICLGAMTEEKLPANYPDGASYKEAIAIDSIYCITRHRPWLHLSLF